MRSILYFIFSLFLIPATVFPQTELDSLLKAGDSLTGAAKVKNLINVSRQYLILSDTNGMKYAREAIVLARTTDYPQGVGMAKLFLGLIVGVFDKDRAIKILIQSSDTLLALGHPWAGYGYDNVAGFYQKMGWYPESLDAAIKAMNACEQIGDTVSLARAISKVGHINVLLGNQQESIVWQKKAYRWVADKEEPIVKGIILGRMGIAYDEMGMFDSANLYNQKAIDLFTLSGDSYYISQWLSNLANTNIKQKKYTEAEDLLRKALRVTHKQEEKSMILINLGKIYLETGHFHLALIKLDSAIQNARDFHQPDFLSEAYYRKYELFLKQNEKAKALTNFVHYHNIRDSLMNEKKSEQIADMKVKYQTGQKEKELLIERTKKERMAKEKAQAEIKVYNRNRWIVGISFLSAVLILLVFAFQQRKKRKIQATGDAAIIHEREKGLKAVFNAQEDERIRIAKDLHDGIGQQLGAIKMYFQSLTKNLLRKNPGLKEDIQRIDKMLTDTGTDVRNISHQMMPLTLTELGLVDAMEDLLENCFYKTKVKCNFDNIEFDVRLPSKVEIALYRIAQELLQNIIKHSGADKVGVHLMKTKTHCILIIEDNGMGISQDGSSNGIGMLNINSRLRTINGKLNLESENGAGTTATVRIALA